MMLQDVGNTVASMAAIELERPRSAMGIDRYNKPRTNYYGQLETMSDDHLQRAVKTNFIGCHTGRDNDARWKVDAAEYECKRRGRPELYDNGWNEAASVDLNNYQ